MGHSRDRFELAQANCHTGGWAPEIPPTKEQIDAAEQRWGLRSYRKEVMDKDGYILNQCGGCRYFAALGSDYGICWNEKSPLDGMVAFEHGGCLEHSYLTEMRFSNGYIARFETYLEGYYNLQDLEEDISSYSAIWEPKFLAKAKDLIQKFKNGTIGDEISLKLALRALMDTHKAKGESK